MKIIIKCIECLWNIFSRIKFEIEFAYDIVISQPIIMVGYKELYFKKVDTDYFSTVIILVAGISIKEQLKSSNITGNILFFKSVEDSIMLRKARMSNRDRLKSVKIGGRYTSRRNRISRATRRKAVN